MIDTPNVRHKKDTDPQILLNVRQCDVKSFSKLFLFVRQSIILKMINLYTKYTR